MNHTPGPWEMYAYVVHGSADGELRIGKEGDADDIAPIAIVGEDDAGELNRANARLIAAAPDLLAALEDAVATVAGMYDPADDDDPAPRALASWRAAIAKARCEK